MRHRIVATVSSLLLALGLLVLLQALAPAPATAATQIIPVPTSAAGLGRIVASPDGSVWFTEQSADKVGKISAGGQVTEYALPAESPGISRVKDLDVAPDGSVWVIYESGERVRHMSAAGVTIVDGSIGAYPYGEQVRVAPDGTAWITMSYDEDYVIRIVGNQIYDDPNAPPCEDALGKAADGSMWCRTSSGLTHLNSTASGGVTYPVNDYAAYPYAVAGGPLGSIWFGRYFSGTFTSSPDQGSVGYLDASSGGITAFDTGSRTAPNDLVQGPDGNMWFTSIGAAKGIGHIAPNGRGGALTAIGGYAPRSLAFGTDGFIYATDSDNNVIIKVSRDQLQTTNVDPGDGSVLAGGSAGSPGSLGKVKAGKKPVAVKDNAVTLRLVCPKDAAQTCVGKGRLTTNAKKKPQAISRSVSYKVKAGRSGQLRLRLTSKAVKALKKGKATKVRLELYAKGATQPAVVQVIKVRR